MSLEYKNIQISVIIPAYNSDKFITFTLNKLKEQTFKSFETVIVNDGSTDNTSQVVKKFIDNNELDWQLINQENKGEGEARNTGLRNAKGEYVLFLDADDYLSNDALDKLYKALINNDADLSFSSYSYVYKNGSKKLYYHPNQMYSQHNLMKLFFRRLANPGIGNTLFKKEFVEKYNIKFEKYKAGADNHFFRRLLLYINKAVSIEDELFFYMYNDSSVMNKTYSFNRIDSILSVLNSIQEYNEKEIPKEIIEYLDIFLINEIKANAVDYYNSFGNEKVLKEKILKYLPQNVKFKYFVSNKRTLWLLSLYTFYKFPISSLKAYRVLTRIKK